MAYVCNNCGKVEFWPKQAIVEHMIDAHDSPFVEDSDNELRLRSLKHLQKLEKGTDLARAEKARRHLEHFQV